MIDCIILGDSIAVGLAQHKTECVAYAKGGINTYQFNRMYADKTMQAKIAIISIGSNDHQHVKTKEELLKIRGRISADKVYWIMPQGNLKASNVPIKNIQDMVSKIANINGDAIINFTASSDGIHPTTKEYKRMAKGEGL